MLTQSDTQAISEAPTSAHAIANGIGTPRIDWQILTTLANLEEQCGNKDAATELRQEARLTLEYIIDHIPEGELRASYVALPEVRRFLDKTD